MYLNVCNDFGYEHLDNISYVLAQSDSPPDKSVDSDEECNADISVIQQVISHKDTMEMMDKCLSWLQSQLEAMLYNTNVYHH